jgi:glycosyltransferase involved in cell wall biosynthesis
MSNVDQTPVPAVSVCIPAYRAERFIAETIDSVLCQTFEEYELIVLDNASDDATAEIVASYDDPRLRLERNPATIPMAENWNAVTVMARAPLVKLLCADDLLHPDCLAQQAAVFAEHPEVVLVSSLRDFVNDDGEVVLEGRGLQGLLGRVDGQAVIDAVVRSGINPIGWPSAMMMRRDTFEAVGRFDPRWHFPLDLELSLRMLEHGDLFGLPGRLAAFRVSQVSATVRAQRPGDEYRSLLRLVAADTRWSIDQRAFRWGLFRSRLEDVKRRLLYAAVNSPWKPVRMLPSVVLGSGTDSRWPLRRPASTR